MLAARIARPAARAAPVRNLTQVSSEARRYSFAHAADDIIGEEWGGEGRRERECRRAPGDGVLGGFFLLAPPPRPPAPTPAACALLAPPATTFIACSGRCRPVGACGSGSSGSSCSPHLGYFCPPR